MTKLDVARCQLETGIRLIFESGDAVSAHTLLFAASELLKEWAKAKDIEVKIDNEISARIQPERRREFHQALRRHALFYKHANNDADSDIEAINAGANDALASWAALRYISLKAPTSPIIQLFAAWFTWVYPNLLTEPPNRAYPQIQNLMAQLRRSEQLMWGCCWLAIVEKDEDALARTFYNFEARYPAAFEKSKRLLDILTDMMTRDELVI